jgi:hypothetical protein
LLAQFFTVLAQHQGRMQVNWRGQAQCFLQQDLPRLCCRIKSSPRTMCVTPWSASHLQLPASWYGPQAIGTFENEVTNFFSYVLLLKPHPSVIPFQRLRQAQGVDNSLHIETPSACGFALETASTRARVNGQPLWRAHLGLAPHSCLQCLCANIRQGRPSPCLRDVGRVRLHTNVFAATAKWGRCQRLIHRQRVVAR